MYVVKTVKANVNVRRVCEDLFRRGKSRPLASLQQAPQHSMHRHNGSFVLATKPAVGVAPGPFAFFNFPFWGDRCAAKIAVLNRCRQRRTQPHVMLEIPSWLEPDTQILFSTIEFAETKNNPLHPC
ncbi:hypothetical protein Peur_033644 [Populus x canadensis]